MEPGGIKKKPSKFIYLAGIAGLVSPILWILLIAVNGMLYPGYSHLVDFISDLGALEAPYAYLQRINFFQFGIANGLVGLALFRKLDRPSSAVVVLQMLIGLGIFLSGIFPGHSTHPDSHESFMHMMVGVPAFVAIVLVPFFAGLVFRKNDSWKDLAPYSMILTPVLAVLLYLMIRADMPDSNGIPGLYQRLLLGIWILWIVLVSFRLKNFAGRA